jgi:HlyD family secretion protein
MNKKRRNKVIRTVVIAVGVLLALIVIVKISCRAPGPPEVEAVRLTPGNIVSTVSADGELKAFNQVDISAEVVAKVERVYVEEGDEVKKGQLLCVLDDDEYRSQRDLNRSQLDQAKASYERGKALFEDELISEAAFEERRTAYEVARAQLDQSNDDLSKTRIYTPISGRVVRVEVEEGETVVMGTMNNAGTVMFTVGDLSVMQAEIYVDETDVASVSIGQPAVVTLDAMPGVEFASEVSAVGYMPASETDTVSSEATEFEVILDLVDVDVRLRPGMTASAEITTAVRENVVTCPLQALGKHNIDGKMLDTVFVLDGDRAKVTPVKTGISDGMKTEITEGLEYDQVIIVGPYDVLRNLDDGDVVQAVISEGEEKWSEDGPQRPNPTMRGVLRTMRRRR